MDVRAINQVALPHGPPPRRRMRRAQAEDEEASRRTRVVIAAPAPAAAAATAGGATTTTATSSVSLGGAGRHRSSNATSGSGSDSTDAAHLKKQRRNERDRRRSLLKRESMAKMRAVVAQLEAQKRKLLALLPPADADADADTTTNAEDPAAKTESPRSPVGDDGDVDDTRGRRREFVRLASEIEALRAANAALTATLRERDMFSSAAQNLMLEFEHPTEMEELLGDDSPLSGDSDASGDASGGASGDGKPQPDARFTPLTADEAQATVRATLQHMARARTAHLSDPSFARGAKFFGWSEFTFRQGGTISFALQKTLVNTDPRALLATTWSFVTDSRNTAKLIRPQLSARYTPLQVLGPDTLVIDRRTEDPCREGVRGQPLAMRTIYLLFWTRQPSAHAPDDASQDAYVLAMKTIDLPLVKRLLRPDEVWCDIFYWIRFAPAADGGGASTAEFGGVNTYVREEIASSWLVELVFLALRWETLAVAPCLLTNC